MGGLHRRYSVMEAAWNVLPSVFFSEEKHVSPGTCAAGVANQRTDSLALRKKVVLQSLRHLPRTILIFHVASIAARFLVTFLATFF